MAVTDEANKSSNDGNSADTEGEGESEIGEVKSPDSDRTVKLHHQPVRAEGHRKHDPNRYVKIFNPLEYFHTFKSALTDVSECFSMYLLTVLLQVMLLANSVMQYCIK